MARRRGSVIRRGDTYTVVLDHGKDPLTGRRERTWHPGYASREEAEKAATNLLLKMDTGRHVDPSRQTVGSYLVDEWLPSLSKQKPNTISSYRLYIEGHVVPRIGDLRLQSLKPPALYRMYADLLLSGSRRGGGLAPRTVQYIRQRSTTRNGGVLRRSRTQQGLTITRDK